MVWRSLLICLTVSGALLVGSATPGLGGVLSDAPLGARRLATQLVEEMRGTGMAPGWELARLEDSAVPLFRPDQDGPAYYEFAVVKPLASAPGFVPAAPA